ncbi:MAG: hypothetical protein KAG45_08075 [Methyloprofundus sp.]|nr:hypothetical protein [Methyloprofundus sp.]
MNKIPAQSGLLFPDNHLKVGIKKGQPAPFNQILIVPFIDVCAYIRPLMQQASVFY